MLDLAGRYSDGTVTWMTGAATLRRDVVPRIVEAAGQAGRPDPRVIAGLPVCVTDDVAGARDRIGAAMAGPASMASYRRMLDAEGYPIPWTSPSSAERMRSSARSVRSASRVPLSSWPM